MAKRIVFGLIFIAFYVLFYKILQFTWNKFMPLNSLTNLIALFILFIINIPLSVACTLKVFKVIKQEQV